MTTAIVPQETSPFEPQAIQHAMALADALSKSALVPASVRGKPADILVIMLTARELGIGPMQGLSDINVIQGKPVFSADLMIAQCKRRGEVCKYIRLVETTAERATYETLRSGAPEPERYTFTIEDARALGIAEKDNWRKQAKTMLRRRAAAALAREVYPDLIRGYDPDEAEDFAPARQDTTPTQQAAAVLTAPPPPEPTPSNGTAKPKPPLPSPHAAALWKRAKTEFGDQAKGKLEAAAYNALAEPGSEGFPPSNTWTEEQAKKVEALLFPVDVP